MNSNLLQGVLEVTSRLSAYWRKLEVHANLNVWIILFLAFLFKDAILLNKR